MLEIDVDIRRLAPLRREKTLEKKNWTNLYLPGGEFASFLTQENERVTEILKSIGLVQ